MRDDEGDLYVNDNKNDFREMNEVELATYLGALMGATLECMRIENKVGSLFLNVHWQKGGKK